jgi:hypothetical protein
MLSRVFGRYSVRATLSVGASVLGLLGLAFALATWQGTPVAGAVPILACALVVGLFLVTRRALRRASARIDAILREEIDAEPVVPTCPENPTKLGSRQPVRGVGAFQRPTAGSRRDVGL